MRPGYKQTEVGVIPEDWEIPKLREHLQQDATYGVVTSGRFLRSGVPMLRGGDIKGGTVCEGQPLISEEKNREYSRTILRDGDVVIALVGYPGETAVVPERLVGANISRAVGLLRPAKNLLPSFLACYLNSPAGRKEFLRPSAGSAQIVVNLGALNKLAIPVPSPTEQSAIATALSDVDALLAAQDALIAKKRAIKQGAMQELLTGKRRLPGFSGEWEVKRLGDVLTIRHGRDQKAVASPDGQFPILATGGRIGWANKWLYDKASVLIGRKGTIDRPQYMDAPFWTVDTLFYSELKTGHVAKFFYYRFCMIDWHVHNEASGVPSLNARSIEQLEVAVPTSKEQAAITAALTDIDTQLTALETQRTKTAQLKQGMMQALLTGRIRLI